MVFDNKFVLKCLIFESFVLLCFLLLRIYLFLILKFSKYGCPKGNDRIPLEK